MIFPSIPLLKEEEVTFELELIDKFCLRLFIGFVRSVFAEFSHRTALVGFSKLGTELHRYMGGSRAALHLVFRLAAANF